MIGNILNRGRERLVSGSEITRLYFRSQLQSFEVRVKTFPSHLYPRIVRPCHG